MILLQPIWLYANRSPHSLSQGRPGRVPPGAGRPQRRAARQRVWRHGAEGRGAPGLPQGARGPACGAARAVLFEQLLAQEYAKGSALNMAATLEIDAVIDPANTREWLFKSLQTQPALTSGNQLATDSW